MMKRHKEVTVILQYLLINVTQILKDVNIIYENVDNQGENVNTQKQIDKINRINDIDETEESITAAYPATATLHKYEQLIGMVTPAVMEGIDFYIRQGVEEALIIRITEYACEQNKRSWQYINAAIRGNMDAGIKSLDAYNRAQADRTANAKKVQSAEDKRTNKFVNYNDTNRPDYSGFTDEIIKEMLEESEKRENERN